MTTSASATSPHPAAPFEHITVLLNEAVNALNIRPDGIYVDGTFGRGGHSRLILSRLNTHGRLIAFDKDPTAIKAAHALAQNDSRLIPVHQGFSHLNAELDRLGIPHIDGLLLDLGVSSPQIDDATRGFSFRFDAPLDMRMDTTRGLTAAEWLNTATQSDIQEVIKTYGEERFARHIATAIIETRQHTPLQTTGQLARLCAQCVRTREPNQDPATRTFQAIRIFINRELEELQSTLPQALNRLKPNGRLAIISFHSLEDRIVKHFLRDTSQTDTLPHWVAIKAHDIPPAPIEIIGKPQRPHPSEIQTNPRARSAILRIAQRTSASLPPR